MIRDDRYEPLAGRLLGAPVTALVALVCLLLAGTWLPGYLTWPWWCDHDHFATVARSWDAGLLPYRDVLCNNFPGPIYQFWALGHLVGWGRTWSYWALDAVILFGFGVALLDWSRRQLGGVLPGLIGLAAAFGYIFNLDYSQAAQRDGQAPLLALAGLLLVLAYPGRIWARFAATVLLSFALAIRPQVALLAPAYVVALWIQSPRSPRETLAVVAFWIAATGACLLLWFAPLLLAGLGPSILDGFRTTVDGAVYSKASPARVAWELVRQVLEPRYSLVLVGLGLLAWAKLADRPTTLVLLTALGGALLYRPLSPLHHAYLAHPLAITWAVALAGLAALVLKLDASGALWRLSAVGLLLAVGLPTWPRYSDPRHWRDFAAWCRGVESTRGPTGYARNPDVRAAADLDWADYRDTLAYLESLPGSTRVANLLTGHAALTGPTGRVPAVPAESTVWLTLLRPRDEARFAESLREQQDAVVVWDPTTAPGQPGLGFDLLQSVLTARYEPAARFGTVEVWRSRPGADGHVAERLARSGAP